MIEHGISELITADQDFYRFKKSWWSASSISHGSVEFQPPRMVFVSGIHSDIVGADLITKMHRGFYINLESAMFPGSPGKKKM
jgi:hypothetical protein